MSNHSELNSYIAQLQKRLRLGAWLRGAAIFTGTALVVTVSLVLILNRFAFPAHGVTAARLAILIALAVAAVFGIVLPLIRATKKWAVRNAEAANPALEQRLTTFRNARATTILSWNCWRPIRCHARAARSHLRWFQTTVCLRSVARGSRVLPCWCG